ncbi:MAG: hypothetical protein P8X85_22280 [Desulfobacterales bacterium]
MSTFPHRRRVAMGLAEPVTRVFQGRQVLIQESAPMGNDTHRIAVRVLFSITGTFYSFPGARCYPISRPCHTGLLLVWEPSHLSLSQDFIEVLAIYLVVCFINADIGDAIFIELLDRDHEIVIAAAISKGATTSSIAWKLPWTIPPAYRSTPLPIMITGVLPREKEGKNVLFQNFNYVGFAYIFNLRNGNSNFC